MPETNLHFHKRTAMNNHECQEETEDSRLNKRLCYLLRYGALKEGLKVSDAGFVEITELLSVNLMRHHTEEEVWKHVEISSSHRGTKRFERKTVDGRNFIRACIGRRFERNPCHEGTNVPTLLESCLHHITTNLDMFDFEDFPDEFLISIMLHRLKRQKKLNNNNLRTLLVPALTHLDMENLYITEATLKLVWRMCPHLKLLSLKDCGYIMTDNLMEQLLKRLPELESLNLSGCRHLTDRTLKAMCRNGKNLKELNLSFLKSLTEATLIELIASCPKLEHLDIYDLRVSKQGVDEMVELARGRGLTIVQRQLTDAEVAPENPSEKVSNFGKVWY